jgi:hypothetical protein
MHSPQLLWNQTVSSDRALNFRVGVDTMREYCLGDIEVHPQTDGNYAAKKQNLPENVEQPKLSQSSAENYQDCQDYHENEKNFG